MRQFNVGDPLERVAVDVLGLSTSTKGNKYILIVGGHFTKLMNAYPMENQRAEAVAEVFVQAFVDRYEVPLQLHSDQGRNFEANVYQMCEILNIDKTRTRSMHPQSDGMVERFDRTLHYQQFGTFCACVRAAANRFIIASNNRMAFSH